MQFLLWNKDCNCKFPTPCVFQFACIGVTFLLIYSSAKNFMCAILPLKRCKWNLITGNSIAFLFCRDHTNIAEILLKLQNHQHFLCFSSSVGVVAAYCLCTALKCFFTCTPEENKNQIETLCVFQIEGSNTCFIIKRKKKSESMNFSTRKYFFTLFLLFLLQI